MTTVNKSVDVNETKINISGLLPKSCYNIDVYTVSFSEISKNPRTFSNVCTQAQLDPNNYTVIYGDSSFMISWVNFSDKYNVTVSCNSWTNMFSLKVPSLSVNKTVPGDCCVMNVKNWNDTVSRQYFVHVNETLPEYPVVIRNVTTRTHLNLTWREPIRSNGWIHGYTVHLFDSTVTTIKNFTVSCIQPEPKCSDNDSDWKHQKYQCSSFSLINNRSAHNYYNNSQFHLSIGGFKPGMLYHYSITAMNKAGSNTTDRIPVFTQADKPESPSSLDITVLNVTTMNITWSPPNVTNGVIMGYRVQYCSNGSSGCKHTVVERMTSVILKDLDCWKEYLVCVSAQTSAGVGRSTCGVNNTSVYEPQSKISKITASNTTIRLDFEMPCDNVETPISYNISYTSLDHSCTGDQTNVTEWWECFPLRPCEITGLFPYWDYFIKVQESAENNVGVWSNEYKVTTLHSVPEEVRNVRAENIKSDSLTVCWEQPCFLNSDTVFYNVMLDEDTPYVNVYRSGSIPETECANITDLLPYTNYTISVTASNQYGNTDPVVIMKQTDIAEPESPASLDITVLNVTTMNITWSPPNVTNGVIIGYNVSYCSKGISGCNYTVVEGRTSVILKDLDCWKEYLVCVSAQTLAGVGRSTCGVNNTSVYEPQAQITKITASNTTIRIEIEVPCDSVELPFSYDISYTSLDHSCTGNQTNVTQWIKCFPLRPCEITGLFSYWDYFIQVLETVGDNVGVWGNEHKVTTLHYVPEKVRNIRVENIESDRLTVCWEQPCFLNSDTVFYNVTLDDDTPYVNVYRSGSIPETECENITDLLPYTNYTISVASSNQYGNTDPVVIMKQTDIAVPNQPSFGRVLEHTTMLTVEWKPPYPYPGPTRYTVKVRDIENSETKHCQTSVYNQTRCSVNGLEEYWQYEVTIMAHTDRGNKQYKHPHYIQTKQSAPGPVTHLRVNHEKDPEKPRLVFITFGPPVYRERNGVIKAYYVKCHDTRTNRDIHVVSTKNAYYVRCQDARTYRDIHVVSTKKVYYVRCHDTRTYRDIHVDIQRYTCGKNKEGPLSDGMTQEHTEIYMWFLQKLLRMEQKFTETVIVPAGAKDFPTTEALAGVSLAFIVFIIAAIVVVILYRRHMVCFKPQFELKEKELVQLKVVKQNKKISVDHEDTRKSRPVKIDKFYQHVEILARDSNHFFSKEYKELKAMAPMLSTEAAEQQEARTKNRYSNILPFDHSRVKLLPLDDEEGSDYINANYIPGFNSKREYIATQGPLPSTKDDFWRMIWEQNVSVIVMLTQCIERGKRKCECYWPECVKEPVYYGDLSIEIENESHLPEYVLRTISVTFGNIQKRIMHFLYLAWPDMGVPSSTDNMI
ncbi:PTPRB [Mytilus coruscus]|uniref:PTPRB n=1 Tax=Mytilus coruscus TaxID=42192 RepID=A0A6J8DYC5_MYTCO|nr:PTPRB [Mytilus coruscus]